MRKKAKTIIKAILSQIINIWMNKKVKEKKQEAIKKNVI